MTDQTPASRPITAVLQRLLGAVILVAAAALLVPRLLDGQGVRQTTDRPDIPEEPAFDVRLGETGEPEVRLLEVKAEVQQELPSLAQVESGATDPGASAPGTEPPSSSASDTGGSGQGGGGEERRNGGASRPPTPPPLPRRNRSHRHQQRHPYHHQNLQHRPKPGWPMPGCCRWVPSRTSLTPRKPSPCCRPKVSGPASTAVLPGS